MAKYELLYIVPGKYTEEELPPITESVKKILEKNQATIIKEENQGKKKLAYSIGENHYGYYVFMVFEVEGPALASIDKELRLMPEVLRHQIVNYLDPAKTTGKAPRPKPEETKTTFQAPTEEKTIIQSIKEKKESQEQTDEAKKKETAKPKIDLDKLDEKLDELLKDDLDI